MSTIKRERIWSEKYAHDSVADTEVRDIARTIGASPIFAMLLHNRGYRSAEEAMRFLRFETSDFHDPFLLNDIDLAVERIRLAVENKEKICIYGDYDVDGVTSVSMLYLYLTGMGADVTIKIPRRDHEGYGMSSAAVDTLAAMGVSLIVTVDTGITANEEIRHARELGVDVVVTDHHECHTELPEACAVVNPHRPDSTYPFAELAGVGVVFKLICAYEMTLCRERGESVLAGVSRICKKYADLAAIGTVADVMPLTDENRLIVSMGLSQLENSPRMGVAALMDAANITQKDGKPVKKRKITSGTIGFGLAPRINAAGRISDSLIAVNLILAENEADAKAYAEELCVINKRRQVEENQIAEQAYEMIEQTHDFSRDMVIVLEHDDWQQGIIGIVSSRITEKYGLPSILISFSGSVIGEPHGADSGKGSGRSIVAVSNLFVVNERVTDFTAFCFNKGVSHTATDNERIALFKQVCNNVELVRNLCTAKDSYERMLGVFQGVSHDGKFFFNQETANRRFYQAFFYDTCGRCVGAVCRTERVVYVNFAVACECLHKFRRFLFFALMETKVFQKHAFAFFTSVYLCFCVRADNVGCERNFTV